MTLETLEPLLLAKQGSGKSFPFGKEYAVYKVMDKVFAIISLNDDLLRINLKVIPEDAVVYRDIYPSVQPGYHMNKKHWNTVMVNAGVSDSQIYKWVDDSYNLVVSKLSKKEKGELMNLK